MEHRVVNPNESHRRGVRQVGVFMCCLIGFMIVVDPDMWPVVIVAVFSTATLLIHLLFIRPFVVLDQSGVAVRYFFRQQHYSWDAVERVGIAKLDAKKDPSEYLFPILIILPVEAKQLPTILWRQKWARTVQLPNRPEIKDIISSCYGPLDFNDTDKLNDWQKKYYKFD